MRNHAELSNYSVGMDWVETNFYGFKPFQETCQTARLKTLNSVLLARD